MDKASSDLYAFPYSGTLSSYRITPANSEFGSVPLLIDHDLLRSPYI